MSDVSIRELVPSDIPPPVPSRSRLLTIGTALVSAVVSVGMGSLLSLYVRTRAEWLAAGDGTWLPRGVVIPLTQPNMIAMTMTLSLVTVLWSVSAMKNDDRPNTYIAIAISLVFGFAYVAQTAYLMTIMEMPIAGDAGARPPLFYAVIGTHMVIMLAAMAYLAGMGLRSLGGNYSSRDVEGLQGAAMFWFVSVGLYYAMWYAIYITK